MTKPLYYVIRGSGYYWIMGTDLPCWSETIKNATHFKTRTEARRAADHVGCAVVRVIPRRPRQIYKVLVGEFPIEVKAPDFETALDHVSRKLQQALGALL